MKRARQRSFAFELSIILNTSYYSHESKPKLSEKLPKTTSVHICLNISIDKHIHNVYNWTETASFNFLFFSSMYIRMIFVAFFLCCFCCSYLLDASDAVAVSGDWKKKKKTFLFLMAVFWCTFFCTIKEKNIKKMTEKEGGI